MGCVAPIVFIVYLGIYAFANPDNEAYVGKNADGEFHMYYTKKAADFAEDVRDVHGTWVTWFKQAFFLHSTVPAIAIGFIGIGYKLCNPTIGSFCICIQTACYSCLFVAWWILGIVYRFNDYGRYAAGDIIPEDMTRDEW